MWLLSDVGVVCGVGGGAGGGGDRMYSIWKMLYLGVS
jgi:hypothetical protein